MRQGSEIEWTGQLTSFLATSSVSERSLAIVARVELIERRRTRLRREKEKRTFQPRWINSPYFRRCRSKDLPPSQRERKDASSQVSELTSAGLNEEYDSLFPLSYEREHSRKI